MLSQAQIDLMSLLLSEPESFLVRDNGNFFAEVSGKRIPVNNATAKVVIKAYAVTQWAANKWMPRPPEVVEFERGEFRVWNQEWDPRAGWWRVVRQCQVIGEIRLCEGKRHFFHYGHRREVERTVTHVTMKLRFIGGDEIAVMDRVPYEGTYRRALPQLLKLFDEDWGYVERLAIDVLEAQARAAGADYRDLLDAQYPGSGGAASFQRRARLLLELIEKLQVA
jgi:hypothetical protein